MGFQYQLRIPGPTPVPERVMRAMNRQMINHRGPEFAQLINEITNDLKYVFQTQNDVLLLTASGTGAMESAIANLISPQEKVLAATCGAFGERFLQIAKVYGADIVHLDTPWGKAVEPDDLENLLKHSGQIKAVLLTHNETSTGITNNIQELAKVAKAYGCLVVVDGVSSIGCINLPVDEWQIDVALTASQKGFMTPPGVAMVSVSEDAWKAYEQCISPRFYLDWKRAKDSLASGQTPYTPAVSVLYGLAEGLRMIREEGLENVFKRHHMLARAARAGVEAIGLSLFSDPRYASDTVTCVNVPEGVDGSKLNKVLREKYDTVLAGGQGKLRGKIFRIGHMGMVQSSDIVATLSAVEQALGELGFNATPGRAVAAAEQAFTEVAQ